MAKVNRGGNKENHQTETNEAVTGDYQAADEAARKAFDAETDASRDPFYAEFKVTARLVQNARARDLVGEGVDEMEFSVTRQRKGAYVALWRKDDTAEPVIGKDSKKPDVAVRYAIRALGQNEKEFMFDAFADETAQAPMPEQAGDNQPDTWFFDEDGPDKDRLEKIAEDVRAADALLTGASRDTRKAWLGFGRAYNAAKAIFAEHGLSEDGENAVRGKQAWGVWLRTRFANSDNVKEILEKKNAAAQAGFFASAPEEVIDASGAGTASTFMRKAEEAAAEFGSAIAVSVLAQRNAAQNESKELSDADAQAEAREKLEAREAAWTDAFDKWKAAAAKAAEKGATVETFKEAKSKGPLVMVRWLFDTAGDDFGKSKLGKAIAKAWSDEITKPTEAEKVEKEADAAAKTIAKRFADMSTEDAAKHLLNILVAHPAPEMVLETVADKLVEWQEAQAAKAEQAAKDAAEAAA